MDDEEFTTVEVETPEIRPDWWVPASVVLRHAGHALGAVANGLVHMADVFVGYSNYEDGRLEFHNAAAAELESILTEESDG